MAFKWLPYFLSLLDSENLTTFPIMFLLWINSQLQYSWAPLVAQTVKNLPATWETWVAEIPMEEGMATHSSILAWRIPWTEEPAGLQSMGSQRVGHSWATKRAHAHTHTHTHTQRANTSHQWVIVQTGLLTCVTVMLTYYRRGIRASKLTRFASIQQSVKIFIWGAPLSHLELDHKMKQGNHRKDGMEGHLNSCWEFPSKCSDGSQNVKEKKLERHTDDLVLKGADSWYCG